MNLTGIEVVLNWKPITVDNLPKVGDEVYGESVEYDAGAGDFIKGEVVTAVDETTASTCADVQYDTWTSIGYTHFRSINAPKKSTDGTKPGSITASCE